MKTALLFQFPFPGPWGEELTEASRGLAHDIATEDELSAIEAEIEAEIDAAVEFAISSPWPVADDLRHDVFAQEIAR